MKMKPVTVTCVWYKTKPLRAFTHVYTCVTLEDLKRTVAYFVKTSAHKKNTLTISYLTK